MAKQHVVVTVAEFAELCFPRRAWPATRWQRCNVAIPGRASRAVATHGLRGHVRQRHANRTSDTHAFPTRRSPRSGDRGARHCRMVCADRRGGTVAGSEEPRPERARADGLDVFGDWEPSNQSAVACGGATEFEGPLNATNGFAGKKGSGLLGSRFKVYSSGFNEFPSTYFLVNRSI